MSDIRVDANIENTKQALSHLHEAISQLFFSQEPTGSDARIASHLKAAEKYTAKIRNDEPAP